MTPELMLAGFLLVPICGVFVTLFLMAFYRGKFNHALIFKGVASLCFVILGIVGLLTSEPSITSTLIFIGLCFGIVGDEVIALCQNLPKYDMQFFIGGGSFFVVGHILYIIALFSNGELSAVALIVSFVVLATLSMIYERYRKFYKGSMKYSLMLYICVVIFMAATAIGVFFKQLTVGAGFFALGGILFAVSDNILFAYKLSENPKFKQNIALHVAYYLAQIAIAFSILL